MAAATVTAVVASIAALLGLAAVVLSFVMGQQVAPSGCPWHGGGGGGGP